MKTSLQKPRLATRCKSIFKNKRNTKAYKKTMKIDIENINIFEKRNKVYTTQWSTIY